MAKYLDFTGREISKGAPLVRELFADARVAVACVQGIRASFALLERLAKHRPSRVARWARKIESALPKLNVCLDEMLEAFPFGLCMVCRGDDELRRGCTACGGKGWFTRADYRLAVEERSCSKRDEHFQKRNALQALKTIAAGRSKPMPNNGGKYSRMRLANLVNSAPPDDPDITDEQMLTLDLKEDFTDVQRD